jgi:hypothetical protein
MSILNLLIFSLFGVIFVSPPGVFPTQAQLDIPLEDVENGLENGTASGTNDTSNQGEDQITLKAELKPDDNQFLAEDGYYDIRKFGFVASNGSELCPQNNCKYGVEQGQFNPDYSGGYSFDGRLKVTIEEDDAKKSKFYDFSVSLAKTSEEERDGEILQFLEGSFGFGENQFSPEISYDITNATLKVDEKNPVLTIQAEREPF